MLIQIHRGFLLYCFCTEYNGTVRNIDKIFKKTTGVLILN